MVVLTYMGQGNKEELLKILDEVFGKKEWLTIKEIAEAFNLDYPSVAEWVREGKLKGLRFGKGWRIRKKWLAEFIQTNF
jgi:excisionase family DNA binding protein